MCCKITTKKSVKLIQKCLKAIYRTQVSKFISNYAHMKKISKTFILIFCIFSITSCSSFKSEDNDSKAVLKKKKINPNVEERARAEADKNSILDRFNKNSSGGNFEFASSNVMWRATLEAVQFMPLQQVDYAGGLIITDWYSKSSSNESVKITFRFLSSELATSSIKITSHKRICTNVNNCETNELPEEFNENIKSEVLKKAREIKLKDEVKK
jgi:hypothetical protein